MGRRGWLDGSVDCFVDHGEERDGADLLFDSEGAREGWRRRQQVDKSSIGSTLFFSLHIFLPSSFLSSYLAVPLARSIY